MAKTIYLDYAAATPLDPAVYKVMEPFYSKSFYNPSADYLAAREVRANLNSARSTIASILGAQASEIIFTAGGTEANNLAIKGIMDNYPNAKILISSIEHDSVRLVSSNYTSRELPVMSDGRIDLDKLKALIDDQTVLLSVMYANNEIGVIEPIVKLSQIIATVRNERKKRGIKLPIFLHSDACQAANYLDLHVNRLGVDLMTVNGGKIYGPKQSGALFVKRGVWLKPLIYGGGQEQNLRSGTENVAANIGLATALELAQSQKDSEAKRLEEVRDYFIAKLEAEIPGLSLNGSRRFRLANNVHVSIKGQDNEKILIGLDSVGIMAAAGSACSVAKEESSHVLLALGLSDEEARSSLRFTLGRQSNKKDIDTVVARLKTLC